jgi:small subunit ribosomal protein S18
MSEENSTNTPETPKMPDVSMQIDVTESEIKKAKEEPAIAAVAATPSAGPSAGPSDRKKFFYTKKVCKFCTRQLDAKTIDYKSDMLKRYVMPSGKILPRRISGNCAKHQRTIVREIKKARVIALLPFLDR